MNQVGPGWSRDYIRWHLPLVVAHDLCHAAMIAAGNKTQWPEQAAAQESAATATLTALKRRFQKSS